MMRCMSSAIAGLKAHQTAVDVIGNNISNVDTRAFKCGDTTFRDTMYQEVQSASAGKTATGSAGVNPSQIGYGAVAASVAVDMSKGGIDSTGRAGDIYIDGEGYIAIADGPVTDGADDNAKILPTKASTMTSNDSVKYTRLGSLNFDCNGYLTDSNGCYVLGRQFDPDGKDLDTTADTTPGVYASTRKLSLIKFNPKKGKIDSVAIGSDGMVTAEYDGKSIKIGQIGLANFANTAGLEQKGDGYYKATENSGTPTYSDPQADATGKLDSGALEGSNVDLATQFSNMIMYERGYQANTKIISVSDEMYQTLVNMK